MTCKFPFLLKTIFIILGLVLKAGILQGPADRFVTTAPSLMIEPISNLLVIIFEKGLMLYLHPLKFFSKSKPLI